MYKLSEPFDSQALESFESRVLASETKCGVAVARGTLTRGWYCNNIIVDIVPAETKKFIEKSTNHSNTQYLVDGKTSFDKATMRKVKHFLGEFCDRKNDARTVEISMFPKPERSQR